VRVYYFSSNRQGTTGGRGDGTYPLGGFCHILLRQQQQWCGYGATMQSVSSPMPQLNLNGVFPLRCRNAQGAFDAVCKCTTANKSQCALADIPPRC
jgi:hypothetical protein